MTVSVAILKSNLSRSGGAEKWAKALATAFHERDCRVTLLTTGAMDIQAPYEIISTSLNSKTSVSKLWEFEAFCESELKKLQADIIVGLDRNRLQTHLRASSGVHRSFLERRKRYEPKWKRLRHLLNPLHSSLLHMEKVGFENPDLKLLFTNSHLVKEEILEHYMVDPEKIRVIHNGVEWQKWQTPFDEALQKERKGPYEILFVGSDFARKGLDRILSNLPAGSHLSVVGTDKNIKHYQQMAPPNCTFFGKQKDTLPFFQRADCLVIPSHYDPFANVTVEALAMGLFVVSSKSNGGCEVLTESSGHIIEDLFSDDSIQSALALAQDHPKTPESAQKIRESVRHLDLPKKLATYVDLCLQPTSLSV